MGQQQQVGGERTARFTRRRAEILDVASHQINLNGVSGLSLTAVARALGLDTSSVTYYFRFKDELAAACLGRTLDHLQAAAEVAASGATRRARIAGFIAQMVETYRRQADPAAVTLATLSDLSALDDSVREPLAAAYNELFATIRRFFDDDAEPAAHSHPLLDAHILLASALWMGAWIDQYHPSDFARVGERTSAVFTEGLGSIDHGPIDVAPLEGADGPTDAQTRFLHAATNLINRIGYKGASVDKIAGELGVSIGSFYHHLNGKDELVVACFDRSFKIIEAAQARAQSAPGGHGARLAALVSLLLAFQFGAESPLLRTSAYQSLPLELRERMLDRTRAATLHIAGLIADGVAEGSLNPVDPLIASHIIIAGVHGAADLRPWAARRSAQEAISIYARALLQGLGGQGR